MAVEILEKPVIHAVRNVHQEIFTAECLKVSEALPKSRAMTMTDGLVLRRLVIVCRIVIMAAVVDPDGR